MAQRPPATASTTIAAARQGAATTSPTRQRGVEVPRWRSGLVRAASHMRLADAAPAATAPASATTRATRLSNHAQIAKIAVSKTSVGREGSRRQAQHDQHQQDRGDQHAAFPQIDRDQVRPQPRIRTSGRPVPKASAGEPCHTGCSRRRRPTARTSRPAAAPPGRGAAVRRASAHSCRSGRAADRRAARKAKPNEGLRLAHRATTSGAAATAGPRGTRAGAGQQQHRPADLGRHRRADGAEVGPAHRFHQRGGATPCPASRSLGAPPAGTGPPWPSPGVRAAARRLPARRGRRRDSMSPPRASCRRARTLFGSL